MIEFKNELCTSIRVENETRLMLKELSNRFKDTQQLNVAPSYSMIIRKLIEQYNKAN